MCDCCFVSFLLLKHKLPMTEILSPALEKKAGGLDGEYSIFFGDCLEKPGRKRVVLIWLGSCVLTRLCFVNNDHKITSYLKRRVK